MLPSAAPTQIVYWLALFKPATGVFSSFWKNRLSHLHAVEELTDLGFQAFGFDCDRIGRSLTPDAVDRALAVTSATWVMASAPTRASSDARPTPSAIDATANSADQRSQQRLWQSRTFP
jgi:hypothetical protein